MTDHEITQLCAQAMGYSIRLSALRGMTPYDPVQIGLGTLYDSLHDDAQCMALVKKFRLGLTTDGTWWFVGCHENKYTPVQSSDLNRAICECVAKMQEAK